MKKNWKKLAIAALCVMILEVACSASVFAKDTAKDDKSGVTFEQMAAQKPLEGIVEHKGHYYIYKRGRMLTGKVKYRGKWYYCHKTASKDYPYGSMVRGMMRIEPGNKWYAYCWDGHMYTSNVYYRKGRFKKILGVEINRKTHCVKYVYQTAAINRGWRYSTAELRWQREIMYGRYKTVESMQTIPDWVDQQP